MCKKIDKDREKGAKESNGTISFFPNTLLA